MESASNELIELFEYLIDKFNIAIEVPKEQLNQFVNQFVNKIIVYKACTSLFEIIICILLLIGIRAIHKKLFNMKVIDTYKKLLNYTSEENIGKIEIGGYKPILLVCMTIISIVITILIVVKIKDLVMCIAFPEKIILEFIGRYI